MIVMCKFTVTRDAATRNKSYLLSAHRTTPDHDAGGLLLLLLFCPMYPKEKHAETGIGVA